MRRDLGDDQSNTRESICCESLFWRLNCTRQLLEEFLGYIEFHDLFFGCQGKVEEGEVGKVWLTRRVKHLTKSRCSGSHWRQQLLTTLLKHHMLVHLKGYLLECLGHE